MKRFLPMCMLALFLCVTLGFSPSIAQKPEATKPEAASPMHFTFNGTEFFHRWSHNGQNEFTPEGQTDLDKWNDMVTVLVNKNPGDPDMLVRWAAGTMEGYKKIGKILKSSKTPVTAGKPPEYFIAALLGNKTVLEAVFARFMILDGKAVAVISSHRFYGEKSSDAVSQWYKQNGGAMGQTLMQWKDIPKPEKLSQLPQSEK